MEVSADDRPVHYGMAPITPPLCGVEPAATRVAMAYRHVSCVACQRGINEKLMAGGYTGIDWTKRDQLRG